MIYAGCPSFSGLGSEEGHVPTFGLPQQVGASKYEVEGCGYILTAWEMQETHMRRQVSLTAPNCFMQAFRNSEAMQFWGSSSSLTRGCCRGISDRQFWDDMMSGLYKDDDADADDDEDEDEDEDQEEEEEVDDSADDGHVSL